MNTSDYRLAARPPHTGDRDIRTSNREIHRGDNLDVLSDMVMFPNDSVDLIYLDPPFNSNVTYNLPFSTKGRKDIEAVAAFDDTWTWGGLNKNYTNKSKSVETHLI